MFQASCGFVRLLCCGCLALVCGAGRETGNEAAPPIQLVEPLTRERAQQALIDMIERDPKAAEVSYALPALRSGQSLVINKRTEGYGTLTWYCDLTKQNFLFMRVGPCWYTYQGEFELTNGKWQARITHTMIACGKDDKD
jgi:hypothetical protein